MLRTAETGLKKWHHSNKRHPLIIRGARQVGKSTLVRDFALHEGMRLNEIDLYRNLHLADIFKTHDPVKICDELSGFLSRDVRAPGSLLFLDEIQAIPEAISALRYFHEEMPELPVVSAGSLLEFALTEHRFSMPVGRVEYMFLGPVTFSEFAAAANAYLADMLTEEKIRAGLSRTSHAGLMELVRQFIFIGGMPEAVQAWLDTGQMPEVTAVHRRITNTYIDDFAKYASGTDLALMQSIFRSMPAHVGEKVKYAAYSRDQKAAKVASAIELFVKARLACPVVHADCNGLPMGAEERPAVRKLLFADCGLMNYANGLIWPDISNLDDVRLVNEGALAEQFIGQHLFFRRGFFEEPRLHYWLREGSASNAEVDYAIERGRGILPIEVKAGKAGSMKSLRQMMLEKRLTEAMRFDTSPYSMQRIRTEDARHGAWEWTLTSVPLYGVEPMTCA